MQHGNDEFLLKLLDQLDEYTKIRESCSQHFARGHLALAQAKYVLGATKISKSSYDGKMEPLIRLETEVDDLAQQLSMTRLDTPAKVEKVQSEDKKLRKRKGEKSEETEETLKATTIEKSRKRDPVQMFGGILAPQPLKIAQQEFKDVVKDVVSMVNIVQRMTALQEKISDETKE